MFSRQSLPSPNLSKPALLLQDAKVRIVSGATSGILSGWFSAPAAQESVSVLNGINLSVPTGAWYMLVGPSGCGKSTLLSVLNNLTPLSSGQALKFGVPVDCWCRKWECCPGTRTGTVFQTPALFEQLTALENVCMGFECREKCTLQEKQQKALSVMEELAIAQFANRYPSELSGGQQQRVSIARALAGDPDLLLMDEPLSALDEANVQTVNEILLARQQSGTTILMASHRLDGCLEACTARVDMKDGRVTAISACNHLPSATENLDAVAFNLPNTRNERVWN
ncbi:ABC transporter ATP-binding protein [Enterovibrio nigricans]|uniref:NitT/TauT family transport system ATP-binding protein n=1 Tax=Enterovibrio nigricans DSM 22720 TaxID=1121868 RepID=A0A1T4UTU3_9GAMM|nr:ATP-binding cassette domain-containing protein [Enterovibrio nigricans]SKA56122.1 NitT/TauT family transport system ATP-binding protein [Enterovibrio nigricans DSM 22720]